MIMNSKDKDVQAKQEGDTTIDNKITKKVPSTSRQWTGFKNPRIVRVSRAFGGKDRHSKVCTIRGLRDRRIRLSVPTAIQLYDLQDRLGLSQPSKVVDWLIDATKHEIDKLPPLQIPPGSFTQLHQPSVFSQESIAPPQASSSLSQFFNGGAQTLLSRRESIDINHHGYGNWSSDAVMRENSKEGEREAAAMEKDASNEQENPENYGGYVAQLSAQNLFPLANQASFPGLLNNGFPYNTYFHWEPSNLSLSRFGNNSFTFQTEDNIHSQNSNHSLAFPSSATLPSGSQLYFCPSVIPPYMNASVENEQRQINHLQLLSSTTQNVVPSNSLMPTLHFVSSPMKSFTENESSKLPPSQENDENQINKEGNY